MGVGKPDSSELALTLGRIAQQGGAAIATALTSGLTQQAKADGTPCTSADLAAEAVIVAALAQSFPEVPVVTEETACHHDPGSGRFFLVDPLDGTRDFLAGRPEFTVNIALIERHRPVAGAIYAPSIGRLWVGAETAQTTAIAPQDALTGAVWRQSRSRTAPGDGLVALGSLSHRDPETERYLARLPIREHRALSSSLKFCLLADGEGDVYARFGPTMEWDTAAGEAVLSAAGGIVIHPDGTAINYGGIDRGFRNDAFVAWGDPDYARRVLVGIGD